jgi:hypothetical protein
MALFTDGIITSTEELAAQDSSVMTVAATEGIDLSQKARLAQEELGIELLTLLPRAGCSEELAGVVVTGALRLWHAFHTLELVYRDAYNSQLNDRYKGRWEEYQKLAKWASSRLLQTGVGMVTDPVQRAGKPLLSTVAGAEGAEERTYYARTAWVNAAGEEGSPSEWALANVPAGFGLVVEAAGPPQNATGWNLYVGEAEDAMFRQNSGPIPVGAGYTLSGEAPGTGLPPGDGQQPRFLRAVPRILQRG